jgi:hypothetical protein
LCRIAIHPKVVEKDPFHGVERGFGIDLKVHWHPRVIIGTADVCRYQEGDIVRLFAATERSLEAVLEPRTKRGSVAKITKTVGGSPKRKKAKESTVKRDWSGDVRAGGETEETDPHTVTTQVQMDKMIRLTTERGARPNPGADGWGVLVRQNGCFVCLWKQDPKASNNVMELEAVIAGPTFLPSGMVVWVSTDSQYVQKGINEWMPNWKWNR